MASDDDETFLALERVYLRLANAKESVQLSAFCEKQLPMLFEKLSSNVNAQAAAASTSTTRKILEILSNLKRRLEMNPDAELPVEFLLEEYTKAKSALSKNFSLIFLKIGFARLPLQEQVSRVKQLIQASINKPYEEQLGIWTLLLPVIWQHYGKRNKRSIDEDSSEEFDLSSLSLPANFTGKFLDFFAQFILLWENFHATVGRQMPSGVRRPSNDRQESSSSSGEEAAPPAPAVPPIPAAQPARPSPKVYSGVSSVVLKTLAAAVNSSSLSYLREKETGKSSVAGSTTLVETKIGIVRMLARCGLASEELAWIWCLAASDAHHSVVHEAEMCLTQTTGSGVNHATGLRKLYEYYLGTAAVQTVPENERRGAVGLRVKRKLMTYFVRYADLAAPMIPQSIQVIFENWFGKTREVSMFGGAFSSSSSDEKLQYSGTEFALHVVKRLKQKTAAIFAPLIFSNVKKLMEQNNDPKLGCLCYAVLGSLGRLHPDIVLVPRKRMEMVQDLFDDLSQIENDDICKAAQSCLFDWLEGFTSGSEGVFKDEHLEACVLAYAEHKSPKCRATALRFIEKLFPFNHAPSRFALFMATNEPDEKVRLEANAILKRMENVIAGRDEGEYDFERTCKYFCEKVSSTLEREEMRPGSGGRFSAGSLKQIIRYLRQLLVVHARAKQPKIEDDGLQSLEIGEKADSESLGWYLSEPSSYKECWGYMELLISYLKLFGAADEAVLSYVSEILFQCPESVLRQEVLALFVPVTSLLSDTLRGCPNEQLITKLAEILSIIYSMTKPLEFIKQEFGGGIQHLQKEKFLLPVQLYLPSMLCEHLDLNDPNHLHHVTTYSQLLCDRLCKAVADTEPGNLDILLHCLKPVALKGALRHALPNDELRHKVHSAVLEVIRSRKEAITTRHKQRSLEFIGCWMTGEPGLTQWKGIVDDIVKPLEGPPNIGLQPSIGELLANYCVSLVGCSMYSGTRGRFTHSVAAVRKRLDNWDAFDPCVQESGQRMETMLNQLLVGEEAEKAFRNKNHKQAVCVWMEGFLRVCGQCASVQSYLGQLQTFFISCLAEKDDFTQDFARRCLFLMFRCARQPEQRSILARSMRDELTATTAKESLLPYQELCQLCSATCQCPELVYDLMLLVLNRQSNKQTQGGAKSENNISSMVTVAVAKMDVYECLLVPLFFRFTYDPIPSVKRVFQNVWASMNECNQSRSLNERTGKVVTLVEKYAGAIFEQLLADLESGQWRYREASCVALNDLINSSNVTAFKLKNIGELWTRCLRVLDDMKESARLAAAKTIKSLKKFTIRLCSPGNSPSTVLPLVMPVLVEFGLQNSAVLVRLSSLSILMALIKEAPARFLKPHLSSLITGFLEALTWTEHESANYMSVRASGEEREQIDQARIQASKSSPIMDSLELCCRQIDQSVMQSLMPKLVHTLQSNVGLATKTGACRLLSILRAQSATSLAPFADSLLKCLTRCMTDRNTAFRKQCASTIGQIVTLCSDSALDQLFGTVQKWYLDSENASMEYSCAHVLRAVATDSPEILRKFGSQVAPIAVLAAQNDPTTEGQESDQSSGSSGSLKEVWEEVTAELSLSMYISDVYGLCARLLAESSIWRVKALSAKTIGILVEKMDPDLPWDKLVSIFSLLTKSLEGRTWDGKQFVLISLGTTMVKYRQALTQNLQDNDKLMVSELLAKECQKTKPKYRVHAIGQSGIIAEALSLDMWKWMWPVFESCLRQESETKSENEEPEANSECLYAVYVALARCLRQEDSQDRSSEVQRFGSLLVQRLPISIWREQIWILDAISIILDKNMWHGIFDRLGLLDSLITTLDRSRQMTVKQRCVTSLRSCCASLVDDPDTSLKNSPRFGEIMGRLTASDHLNNYAKDLVEKMEEFQKN